MTDYHPGLEGVIATESSISEINGEKGIISYSQIVRLKPNDVSAIEEEFDIPGCFNRFSWQYQAQQLIDEEEEST